MQDRRPPALQNLLATHGRTIHEGQFRPGRWAPPPGPLPLRPQKLTSGAIEKLVATVRLQMVWDNLSCLGTEALARLGLRLGGFQLMFQSSLSDGVAFDPFSFQKDGSASAEVDVGRCQVL
jgi:hypothetical protein